MVIYKFKRLIEKYKVACKLVKIGEGKWVAGTLQQGKTTTEDISGAIVPITEQRIQNSGGTYLQGDCEFITMQPIEVTSKTYIERVDNGKKYKLQNTTDYSDYADFNVYLARRVSAFDTASNDTARNA